MLEAYTITTFQCLDNEPHELVEMLNKSRLESLVQPLEEDRTSQAMIESKPSALNVNLQTAEMIGHSKPNFVYQTSGDIVEKRMILLNYCLSDIERFHEDIGRHQDDHSVKMNDLRATDFVGIFQKIKLAINLLVRKTSQT